MPELLPHNLLSPEKYNDANADREFLTASSVYVAIGICQLNQWALDFDGNCERIMRSTEQVKKLGGYYRMGPELEVPGYSCDDHFYESDTTGHCWQTIVKILQSDLTHNCIVDVGMPVDHQSVRYNCRVFMLNREIILIRPKMFLANDGAYREVRWFGAYKPKDSGLEEYVLPKSVQRIIGQRFAPFGFAAIQANDCMLAAETCEELFVPESPHLAMCLSGVDIFTNGSASYYEVGKLKKRFDLILAPTAKMGGVYAYCNTKGCDGGSLGFDGASFIAMNGEIINMIRPFKIKDVEVMVERVNVTRVRSFRACNPSYNIQARGGMHCVKANIWLSGVDDSSIRMLQTHPKESYATPVKIFTVSEELGRGISLWLWDYLRRSGGQGFFVALSGGEDSSTVASIVRVMCQLVIDAFNEGDEPAIADLENVLRMSRSDEKFPQTAQDLCFQILHTCFMSTENSSKESKVRARHVAKELGSYHLEMDIGDAYGSTVNAVGKCFGRVPRYMNRSEVGKGGHFAEDVALQNAQARLRMVMSYFVSSLLPTYRALDRWAAPPTEPTSLEEARTFSTVPSEACSFLLVLASSNLDESVRGYYTKYDCSSGDLNPIGAMSKITLRKYLKWAAKFLNAPSLLEALTVPPSSELRPETYRDNMIVKQTDEEDMGMTYNEIQ